MKQTEFRQLVKECINEVLDEIDGHEPYDAETDTMAPAPRDRTEPVEPHTEVDKTKMKMLNDILVTCGNMQKRVHSLTDTTIINGISRTIFFRKRLTSGQFV